MVAKTLFFFYFCSTHVRTALLHSCVVAVCGALPDRPTDKLPVNIAGCYIHQLFTSYLRACNVRVKFNISYTAEAHQPVNFVFIPHNTPIRIRDTCSQLTWKSHSHALPMQALSDPGQTLYLHESIRVMPKQAHIWSLSNCDVACWYLRLQFIGRINDIPYASWHETYARRTHIRHDGVGLVLSITLHENNDNNVTSVGKRNLLLNSHGHLTKKTKFQLKKFN